MNDTSDVLNSTGDEMIAQIGQIKSEALLKAQQVVDSIEAKIADSSVIISQANSTLYSEATVAAQAAKDNLQTRLEQMSKDMTDALTSANRTINSALTKTDGIMESMSGTIDKVR